MSKKVLLLLTVFLVSSPSNADIYMHNPRGSNNRLDEATRQRATNNRLFDSENNERGGYNVGNMYYYVGSQLQIEWTNQHSCNSPNSNCDIIIQYMCSANLRDGTDTREIPKSNSQCANNDCNRDLRFGMHEDIDYYIQCSRRSRNKGLFIAEQNVGQSAMNTRQNPNGQTSAYECSEERDYYPYWHPSPWIDIAVLTNNPKKCKYYQNESENVKGRWYCVVPNGYITNTGGLIPNNQIDCEKLVYNGVNGVWTLSPPNGFDAPECKETQFTRDNHLGNTYGGNPPVYNWTIPNNVNTNCALRIRYNISTNDYPSNADSTLNSEKPKQPSKVPIYTNVGLSQTDAQTRGYLFQTDPQIKLFADLDFKLKLNIDTAQYGRVFQDRSHRFAIVKQSDSLVGQKIQNLNVRGKRGNIVQVYPAVEYDFVPNRLLSSINDYIHFQWTGSNTNPNNNAGQGTAGSDRNNIIILSAKKYDKGVSNAYDPLTVTGQWGVNYPANFTTLKNSVIAKNTLQNMAILATGPFGGSSDELNDAGTYYDVGAVGMTDSGVVNYMCTRNNNFSNRDQKGQIIILNYKFTSNSIGVNGGTMRFTDGNLIIPEDTFSDLTYVQIDILTPDQMVNTQPQFSNIQSQIDKNSLASNYIRLNPYELNASNDVKLQIKLNDYGVKSTGATDSISAYRISPDYAVMTKLKASINDGIAIIDTKQGGIYFVKVDKNYGVVIGAVIGVVVFLTLVTIIGILLYRNPKYINNMRNRARYAKRSLLNRV